MNIDLIDIHTLRTTLRQQSHPSIHRNFSCSCFGIIPEIDKIDRQLLCRLDFLRFKTSRRNTAILLSVHIYPHFATQKTRFFERCGFPDIDILSSRGNRPFLVGFHFLQANTIIDIDMLQRHLVLQDHY